MLPFLNSSQWTPDYSKPYRPCKESLEFFSWCNINLAEEDNITPKVHYQMVDVVLGQYNRVQVIMHRGGAKTTVLNTKLALYVASLGYMPNFLNNKGELQDVTNLMIFSGSEDQAIGLLDEIIAMWENSPILQKTLRLDKATKKNARFINERGNKIYIGVKGSGQSMRGTKRNGKRPQLLLLDDVLPDTALFSKVERLQVTKWFTSSLTPSVDMNFNKIVSVGTPFTEDDILMKMKKSNEYKTISLPVCKAFPVKEEDIVGSWEDRFTPAKIMALYREAKDLGEEGTFYREFMLQVTSEETRLFKDKWIRRYNYAKKKPDLSKLNFFTSMDIAVSKKSSGDYRVVTTVGVDKDKNWFIVRSDVGNYNPSELIEILFKHINEYRPLETRAEKASLQQVLDHFIQLEMQRTGTYFNYTGLELNSSVNKEQRISALQPLFKTGKIFFPEDRSEVGIAELEYEYQGMTKEGATTPHDDAIDTLANFLDPDFLIYPSEDYGSEVGSVSESFNDDANYDYY